MSSSNIAEALKCEHYWAWVSPGGAKKSARLCMLCHVPDPNWLNSIYEKPCWQFCEHADALGAIPGARCADGVYRCWYYSEDPDIEFAMNQGAQHAATECICDEDTINAVGCICHAEERRAMLERYNPWCTRSDD